MNKEVNLELLESYLAGDINANEVLDREGNVLSAEELAAVVTEYEDTLIHIEGAALKKELREMQGAMAEEASKPKYRWWPIAASVLILLTAGLLWQNVNQEPEFSDYFKHFSQLRVFRAGDEDASSKAMEAYSRKDYSAAYSLLSEIATVDLDKELKFYMAVSALGSNHVCEAVSLFEGLDSYEGNKYYQQVNWYLALSYWENDDLEKAINRLKIIQKDQYKYKEAQELLEELS